VGGVESIPSRFTGLLEGVPAAVGERLDAARELARGLETAVWWAGGGVRDLVLGREPRDLDLVVEGRARAEALAVRLAARLGAERTGHDRFGTSTLRFADGSVLDVAMARREVYDRPGALPRVAPADLAQDLGRRDFSLNAIALRLEPSPVEIVDPCGGLEDLAAGRLRTLHAESFRDDATRILRGVRFEVRFGFRLDPATESAARAALSAGYLGAISGPRLRRELEKLLGEPETAPAGILRCIDLGVAEALDPEWRTGDEPARRLATALSEAASLPWRAGGLDAPRPALLGLLVLLLSSPVEVRRRVADRLGLARSESEVVVGGPERVAAARRLLAAGGRPPVAHEIAAALRSLGSEELAAAAATDVGLRDLVVKDLATLRPVRLRLTGSDLRRAGIPAGPAIGRVLARTLEARLDGALEPEGELEYALDVWTREGGK
jgi:tRNA nucleotidyltransferase (CCA-adding enzyme)